MTEASPAQESLRHWSAVAPAWEAYRNRLFEQVRSVSEWLVDRVDPQPGQSVLELTAGPGETGFLAVERLGPTGRLISSDFVPAMVEAAQRGAAQRGLGNVEFRVLDAQQIDLPDGSVDGVLSRFGLMRPVRNIGTKSHAKPVTAGPRPIALSSLSVPAWGMTA